MALEDKILDLLKESGGNVRRGELCSLHNNKVFLARVINRLMQEGKIELRVVITDHGRTCKPRTWGRREPKMSNYDLLRAPPQHIFKEVSDDDLNRIREEALSARELVG